MSALPRVSPRVVRILRALLGLAALGLVCSLLFARCTTSMPGSSYEGPAPALAETEVPLARRLEAHVRALADGIGPRNASHPEGLARAELWVAEQLALALRSRGSDVAVERHEFAVGERRFANFGVRLEGSERPDEIVVVGAHYDSCRDTPGADDNASGVAVLLELLRSARARGPLPRTLEFVAFANEEPPYFGTEDMGSRRWARRSRERGEDVVAMLSLETLAYYDDAPGSQRYPFPFGLCYPDTGDFVGFVGNRASAALVRRSIAAFRRAASFPSEGLAAPGWVPGVWWSDHASFWKEGYPALMVTDTAPFRNPHYHRPSDVPGELDFEALARVTGGLEAVVWELCR